MRRSAASGSSADPPGGNDLKSRHRRSSRPLVGFEAHRRRAAEADLGVGRVNGMSRQHLSPGQAPFGVELGPNRPAPGRVAVRHRPAGEQGGDAPEDRRGLPEQVVWHATEHEIG